MHHRSALWAFAIPIEVVSCTSGGSNINQCVCHFQPRTAGLYSRVFSARRKKLCAESCPISSAVPSLPLSTSKCTEPDFSGVTSPSHTLCGSGPFCPSPSSSRILRLTIPVSRNSEKWHQSESTETELHQPCYVNNKGRTLKTLTPRILGLIGWTKTVYGRDRQR
jgi:hypothetical protein